MKEFKAGKLWALVDAILDGAIEESLDYNLSSVDVIEAYSENGMGVVLDVFYYEVALHLCRSWTYAGQKQINLSSLEWDRMQSVCNIIETNYEMMSCHT